MFYSKLDAQQAAQSAAQAAQSAAQAAHSAAQIAQDKTQSARVWAAPRLENAADYVTETMAPGIAGALRSTARQISPDRPDSRLLGGRAVRIAVLAVAAITAAGAAAALVRHKYKAAMEADSEIDVDDIEDSGEPGHNGLAASKTDAAVHV